MASKPFLQIVPQRHTMDCAVACLAMLGGFSYEDILMQFEHNVIATGATIKQIKKVALLMGFPLTHHRKFDVENDTGILCVRSPQWKSDHLTLFKEGLVIDTDASIWDYDCFLVAYGARPVSFLKTEKGE